ncbi:ribosomal protection-like ABC-F family protein [Oceanobacillus jeddahense]|uniref:ABC-F type ribosomal protection protein n=1 Tax=Oceanobacillus jeddahense TaxID=1462527 RepID=A0ABY5JU95_9BACI|nr:ABC-F type ribosomal protection protein [Oceanobacillus jeddahense]UUI03913.1 ABC-F type ribosomal protection protein [Oceanobacillus jeddahense]
MICQMNQVKKMYGGNIIFEDISLEVKEKERIGIVGRNGGGKTTLLRLMAGITRPDEGNIHWKKAATIGYLEQIPQPGERISVFDVLKQSNEEIVALEKQMKKLERAMQNPESEDKMTVNIKAYGEAQERFTVLGGYELEANIDRITTGLQINDLLQMPFEQISGGEKTKVGLAKILLQDPDLLLLDEPTNHLDLQAVEWLGEFLNNYEGTVVLISHDRYFLDEVAGSILDLEDGELAVYHTNFSGYVKEKEERLLREFQAYEEQQKKIKKMKEAIKRLKEWANRANPPNEGLHKRAKNMERALERMEKIDKPQLNRKKMQMELDSSDRSGKDVIVMTNVRKQFEQKLLFDNVDMHIRYQDRVAIIGENGTGKSTLIQLMLGNLTPDQGEVMIGSNVKFGYLSQHVFHDNDPNQTVLEAFREAISVTEGKARHILAKFLFYGEHVFRKVTQLSGGEKMRLRLAQLMHQDINTLILDEPTNHLDIDSREVLEETLEGFEGSLIAVSHDRYFLDKQFDYLYWIENKQISTYLGNYSWAKEKRNEQLVEKQEAVSSSDKKPDKKTKKSYRTIENPSIMIEKLEKEIETLEAEIYAIELSMTKMTVIEELQKLQEQKENKEKERQNAYEKLLVLENKGKK